jgi:murein DD-endopeptidase MepM/ murein hydrolase activator NlpD
MDNKSPMLGQIKTGKQTGVKKSFLTLALAISVSLNIYFVWFYKDQAPMPMAEASLPLVITEVQAGETISEPPSLEKKEAVTSTEKVFEVAKGSFEPSYVGRGVVRALSFKIKSSLNYSLCKVMSKDDGCLQLSAYISRLLTWNLNVNKEMRKGDLVRVIYEELQAQERFHILKLGYRSSYHRRSFFTNFYHVPGRKYGGYFDANGQEISPRIIDKESPIRDYIDITSLPGDYRKGRLSGHRGTDFKAHVGTPIYSSFSGKVVRRNWNTRVNGYCLEIDHPKKGVVTRYLHLSRALVKKGDFVKQGQKVGESGNTGRSYAPHLHYEVQHRSGKKKFIHPFKSKTHQYIKQEVPLARKDEFLKTAEGYESLFEDS